MQHARTLGLGLLVIALLAVTGCARSSKAPWQALTEITKSQDINGLASTKLAGALSGDDFESLSNTIVKRLN